MNIAMIPARMGSQRLKQKHLRELGGVPLITHAIHKSALPLVCSMRFGSTREYA